MSQFCSNKECKHCSTLRVKFDAFKLDACAAHQTRMNILDGIFHGKSCTCAGIDSLSLFEKVVPSQCGIHVKGCAIYGKSFAIKVLDETEKLAIRKFLHDNCKLLPFCRGCEGYHCPSVFHTNPWTN